MTELCEIAWKYGSDKCPRIKHDYTPFYYEMFKDRREEIKKVFEIGIGIKKGKEMRHAPDHYKIGASLFMWRDFFPNAEIYGMDIEPECIFQDDRIHTFLGNQAMNWDMAKIIKNVGTDIDIFIDDGSHNTSDQIFTCVKLLPKLKKETIYIIEDAHESKEIMTWLTMFDVQRIQFPRTRKAHDNRILIVRQK